MPTRLFRDSVAAVYLLGFACVALIPSLAELAHNNLPPCVDYSVSDVNKREWQSVRITIPGPASWSHAVHWWLVYPLKHQQHFVFDIPSSRGNPLDLGSWLLASTSHTRAPDGSYYKCFTAHVELRPELIEEDAERFREDTLHLAGMAVLVNGYGPCVDALQQPIPDRLCHKTDQLLRWLQPEAHFVVPTGRVVVDMTTRFALRLNLLKWNPFARREYAVLSKMENYRLVIAVQRSIEAPQKPSRGQMAGVASTQRR